MTDRMQTIIEAGRQYRVHLETGYVVTIYYVGIDQRRRSRHLQDGPTKTRILANAASEGEKQMTKFRDTDEAARFIASGDSRETSPEIMEAIAFFARDLEEAERLWEGDGFGSVCLPTDLWERVTGNGRRSERDFCWGDAGTAWWDELSSEPDAEPRYDYADKYERAHQMDQWQRELKR